jgi:hypothetical protein
MKFGLGLSGLSSRRYSDVSAAAGAAGFESVRVPDRICTCYRCGTPSS